MVAEAYGEVLTWDSLAQLGSDDLNLTDSAAFAERVIDRWLREQVLLNHARKHLARRIVWPIEQALEAYRRSLLIGTYETGTSKAGSTTFRSEEVSVAYHDAHPELFTLHDHAVQALYTTCRPQEAPERRGPIGRVARPAPGTTAWSG